MASEIKLNILRNIMGVMEMCECKPENELYYRNNNEFLGVREVFIDNYGEYKGNLVICTGKKIKEYEKEIILIKINYCPMCGRKLED